MRIRKLLKSLVYLMFLAVSTLLLMELSYRWYIVDFYGGNLRLQNEEELVSNQPSILVIGDSFSADQKSYVSRLREEMSSHRVVNASVPGTCVKQHTQFAKRRFRQFQPELFIYQVYVGNDLLEFRHPTTGPGLSWQRKLYWWMADRFLVLGYINAKLPHIRQYFFPAQQVDYDAKVAEVFSPEHYSARSKLLLKAEPELLENSVLLQRSRKDDMKEMVIEIEEMIDNLAPEVPVLVLVMPHCVQMGAPYIERMKLLGAEIDNASEIQQEAYPFYNYLESRLVDERTTVLNALTWLSEKNGDSCFFANDPHLNPRGQQIVGDSLIKVVNQLLPVD